MRGVRIFMVLFGRIRGVTAAAAAAQAGRVRLQCARTKRAWAPNKLRGCSKVIIRILLVLVVFAFARARARSAESTVKSGWDDGRKVNGPETNNNNKKQTLYDYT